MELEFSGPIWYWRGPSPFHFVTVPEAESGQLEAVSGMVSYGWGMIPATVQIGSTQFSTALFPKDGGYVVPIKAGVRRAEGLEVDDVVRLQLSVLI